jgi:hypothetical protein
MPMTGREVRAVMRSKGWSNIDLAAHWGHSVSYISWLVHNPHERPRVYDDAFRGLLERSKVEVVLEARHKTKPRPEKKRWTVIDMYPVGRIFVTQDSRLGPEEGTDLAVTSVRTEGGHFHVQFEVLAGDAQGDFIEIEHGPDADSLSDTGLDRTQRAEYA